MPTVSSVRVGTTPPRGELSISSAPGSGRSAYVPLPFSCQAILTQNPPSGSENHGCPYRHFNQENLVSALGSYFDITAPADIKEIMDAVAQHKHHVACTRVFEITHGIRRGEGVGNGETVTHPNKYAARSRELEREKNGGGTAVKSEDAMDVDA